MTINESKTDESISFRSRGEAYVLERIDRYGKKTELILSEHNVLFLPRILQDVIHKILSDNSDREMEQSGAVPIVAVPVVNVRVAKDAQAAEILLTMCDKFGNESSFSFPLESAKPLARHILSL